MSEVTEVIWERRLADGLHTLAESEAPATTVALADVIASARILVRQSSSKASTMNFSKADFRTIRSVFLASNRSTSFPAVKKALRLAPIWAESRASWPRRARNSI